MTHKIGRVTIADTHGIWQYQDVLSVQAPALFVTERPDEHRVFEPITLCLRYAWWTHNDPWHWNLVMATANGPLVLPDGDLRVGERNIERVFDDPEGDESGGGCPPWLLTVAWERAKLIPPPEERIQP
mgnify:CR=1 FL=1